MDENFAVSFINRGIFRTFVLSNQPIMNNNKNTSPVHTAILKIFAAEPFRGFNYKQIASRLGAYDRASREMVQKAIEELARNNVLEEESIGKFKIRAEFIKENLPSNTVIGIVDMKRTGKAYVIPESGNIDDIYIAPNNTGHAFHQDKVKVRLFPRRKGRKVEGQITEVLERNKKVFVGTISIHSKYAFLIPDGDNIPVDIYIPLQDLNNAKNGQKVQVEITEWPERMKSPFGKVVFILGTPGENDVEMQSILAEYDFPLTFPSDVLSEADALPVEISQDEIARRRDFRNVVTYTIDPSDAKDFDDAISYRKLDNGLHEVGVHIADVSFYVKPGSAIDREAYERGTSVYLVDRTFPMLPEKLCNEVCSLRPNEDKLCFSAVFQMNDQAKVMNQWFGKTVIRSQRRFSYEEAQGIIEGEEDPIKDYLLPVHHLAEIMRKERFEHGAINFETQEVGFHLDEQGKPIGVFIKESKEANWLIEEFMLLANKQVATFVGKPKGKEAAKTFIYRVHDEPNPEKLATFNSFVGKLGYRLKLNSRQNITRSFNKLLSEISGKAEETMISTIAIRTMTKAFYTTDNIGHYGLGFDYYSHFTSPIRRYPDLMVHRLLDRYLQNKPSVAANDYEFRCEHCSKMERKAADAERTSIKYKQSEYLADKIGEVFDGVISGVSKWGLYVLIDENKCEGLVPIASLEDDYYYLDEDNYQVLGRHYGKQFRLGDGITIRVKSVNLEKKQIDFEYVDVGKTQREPHSRSKTKENTRGRRNPGNAKKTKHKTK